MKPATPTLNGLRQKMNSFERTLLDEVWQHFQTRGEWPTLRKLYRDHGKQKVKEALAKLGGSVGHEESGGGQWHRYSLTLLGALLTGEGELLQSLMLRFFELQRDLFQKNPEATGAKSEEIQKLLGLSKDDTALLGKLVRLGNFGGSYSSDDGPWSVSAMPEADEFPETGELTREFERWLFRFYQPKAIVFDEQRRIHQPLPAFAHYGLGFDQPHPTEISQSLNRLRNVYPDGTKLGFLIMRFTGGKPFERIVKAIRATAKKHGLAIVRADETHFHADLWGNVRTLLHGCGFGIAIYERIDKEEPNANVGLEVGYLMAMNKPVLLLKDQTVTALQSDLAGKLYVSFDPHDPERSIPEKMTRWLEDNGVVVPKHK